MTSFILLLLLILFFVGMGLFVRGWRGEPVLSEPRCAKCGYDLRGFAGAPPTVCTECGSDLTAAHAVRWGTFQRRPRLMCSGAALAGVPLLLIAAVAVGGAFGVRPGRMPRSNQALINSLKTTANQPWDWREIEQRHTAGVLSDEEAAKAVDQLIAHLNASATPGQQPLHWADRFVERLDKAGVISDEQFARLAEAFYGNKPKVDMSPRARQGAKLRFDIDYGGSWNLPGVQMVQALRAVKLADGRALPLSTEYDSGSPGAAPPNPDHLSGRGPFGIDGKVALDGVPPGEHTLTFVLDAGVLKEGTLPQIANGNPGQARHWPRGRARWTMDVPVKVTVVPADQSPIDVVTDPALDPQKAGVAKVKRAAVIRTGTGPRLTLELEFGRPPVALSFDVFAKVAGQELPLGTHVTSEEGRSQSTDHTHTFDALAPDVRSIDVTLRPNPAHAEGMPGVSRTWGGAIELRNVKLERHDLDTPDAPPGP